MKIEIGSFKFPGFYESIFCNSDDFYDDEYEMKYEIANLLGVNEDQIEVEYEYENFNEYKINVCETFMEYYVDKIIEVLPAKITDKKKFKLEIAKEDDITIISPKYYNYSTDRCYCNIKTNWKTLKRIKKHTLKLEGAKKYLLDHFTSRDGFISFVSNDIDYWKELDIKEYEENMIIALLDMLISLSDPTGFEEICFSTYYDVDKYYYASPTVTYKEKDPEKYKKDMLILEEYGYKING